MSIFCRFNHGQPTLPQVMATWGSAKGILAGWNDLIGSLVISAVV